MIGISWGGFNALQMAHLQPAQLKTVVSLCSTDDRYNTDVHYDGGCLTADGMTSWASQILCWSALPPDPRHVSNWRDIWLNRLKASSEIYHLFSLILMLMLLFCLISSIPCFFSDSSITYFKM